MLSKRTPHALTPCGKVSAVSKGLSSKPTFNCEKGIRQFMYVLGKDQTWKYYVACESINRRTHTIVIASSRMAFNAK